MSIINHIYIVGTGSSVLTALLLTFALNKFNNPAYKYFQRLLVALALSVLANTALAFLNSTHPVEFSFSDPFQLLVGPFFYFYLVYLVNGTTRNLNLSLHVIPFGLVLLLLITYLMSFLFSELLIRLNSISLRTLAFLVYIQMWVYFFLCHQKLKQYRIKLKRSQSEIDRASEAWISRALIGLLASYFVLSIVYLLNHGHFHIPVNRSLGVIQAGFVYYICYSIFRWSIQMTTASVIESTDKASYAKSGLDPATAAGIESRLMTFMDKERPHLNPELSISMLAGQLDVSAHHLSQVINSGKGELAGKSFYDFINAYRVRTVQAMLDKPSLDHLKIIEIAFDAGFSSKATFNRVFKKHTGQTPFSYRKRPNTEK